MLTNDHATLVPKTEFEGPALNFSFPGLRVGVGEYEEGPTGCTVFHFPEGATAVADVRGGAPATYFTDFIRERPGPIDAICLAGGSAYGLEAAAGVAAELLAQRDYVAEWRRIALVTGAILFDFRRGNSIYPDKALGRAAVRSAREGWFPLGARGAGRSATVGKWLGPPYELESAGQGAAFQQVGPTALAVFAAVNAVGGIVDRRGQVVRGHRHAETGQREKVADVLCRQPEIDCRLRPPRGNTTLTVAVTNLRLAPDALRQLARQVHDSMARALDPFHTVSDGDVLYLATAGEVENLALNDYQAGLILSELAWDAVLNCF